MIITENKSSMGREQMNVVIIGHVDHGKSTVVGRLLADTNSLPEGKLQEVRTRCAQNSRPFEYAFLLDALKDEQDQGITIDSARCFFKSAKREYILIDAPGHIEFLKNMVSGAARAEAALLVIDAKEGVRENSRRHGYLLSMLGIRQMAVAVNKLDLVDYSKETFDEITEEYTQFLSKIGVEPACFIPVSAREGDNITNLSSRTPWYDGPTVLQAFDEFAKAPSNIDKPLRFPVQDIYRFTEEGDDRRIVAGRIETGSVKVGDEVIFLPSEKKSKIASIEGFNIEKRNEAYAGQSTGFTLDTQIYIRPGELMCKVGQTQPLLSSRFRANIFWLGRHPMIPDKRYKMKLAEADVPVWLRGIDTVLDASDLTSEAHRDRIERHDVADCVIESLKPIAFDQIADIPQTGRFVIVDNYEIAGGGIILAPVAVEQDRIAEHVERRQKHWDRSGLTPAMRSSRYGQRSTLILITGAPGGGKMKLAKALEAHLFNSGRLVYYLGLSNTLAGIDADLKDTDQRDEYLRRLGEVSHLFTDAGMLLITTVSDLDDYELEMVETLNKPNDCVVVNIGDNRFTHRQAHLQVDKIEEIEQSMRQVKSLLQDRNYLIEYYV